MGATQIDQRQPALQLLKGSAGEIEAGYDSARVVDDLDEIHAAERGAELVLNAALPTELDGLDGVRLVRDLGRRAPAADEPIQRAEERDENCC